MLWCTNVDKWKINMHRNSGILKCETNISSGDRKWEPLVWKGDMHLEVS